MGNNVKNRKIFYVLLTLLPIVLLVLIEVGLRLTSFGYDYPLFIKSKSMQGYIQPNPEVIKRYFSNPELAPEIKPDTFFFNQIKSKESFRIVVQGGSTAAGFPFGRFGSLQGMLQQRFKRIYPNKKIEIISTAMSAVNSYTLLDFSDEIIEIKPDLILIYAGHNEFLGIMGVGSNYAAKANRPASLLFLKLKNLKLFQLMQSFIQLFQSETKITKNKNINKRNLMAAVAKNKTIDINSETYRDGLEQFSGNLNLLLNKYKKHNIPVIISTLASNEKDQPPFSSSQNKPNAVQYFKAGRQHLQNRKYKEAKEAFINASDYDLLRFRAPSKFNQIIRNTIDNKNVYLVDAQQRIRRESQNSIIGFQHMFEHLHPNARGYFLLGEIFVDEIVSRKFISDHAIVYPIELAWNDIPLTEIDLISARFKIRTLVSDYPFTNQKQPVSFGETNTFERKMAKKKLASHDWLLLQQEILQHYQTKAQIGSDIDKLINLKKAAKVAGIIFDAFPNNSNAAWLAGKIYFSINDTKIAEYYLKQAISLKPNQIEYLMNFAYALYVNKNTKASLEILERVLTINPNHKQALKQKNRITREL